MAAIRRLLAANGFLLIVAVWVSCAGNPIASSGLPTPGASGGVLSLSTNLWTTISGPQNFTLINHASGSLIFDFPSEPGSMNYLYNTRPPGTIAGRVIVSLQVTTTGVPIFNYMLEPGNTCVTPATVRPFLWAHQDSPAEFDRWWARSVAYELAAGSTTMTVPLNADQWSSVNGKLGNADAGAMAGFDAALKAVSSLGLTFGGGCFFGHGVNVSGGTARFVLTKYEVGQ